MKIKEIFKPFLGTSKAKIPGVIGKQVWMIKNLDVANFRNGDPIPEIKTSEEWEVARKREQPAWCYFNNDPRNGAFYGRLYNWYSVNDPRGLAPDGWYIPSNDEFNKLFKYLGTKVAGVKLKSETFWVKGNGSNESGFLGLPGGHRQCFGAFAYLGLHGYWWSSSEIPKKKGCSFYLELDGSSSALSLDDDKGAGMSVRCLRYDKASIEEASKISTDSQIDIRINICMPVRIGNLFWMDANLNEKNYRNGDSIPKANNSEEWKKFADEKKGCWFNDGVITDGIIKYGKLYNWYALNDPRGLAPEGWHIANDAEWKNLIESCGGNKIAGIHLKSKNEWGLVSNSFNSSHFSAIPRRGYGWGDDMTINYHCEWWSATEKSNIQASAFFMMDVLDEIQNFNTDKSACFAVRCVKN